MRGLGILIYGAYGGDAPGKPEPAEVADVFLDEHAAPGEVLVLAEFPLAGEDRDRARLIVEGEVVEIAEGVIGVADVAVEILVIEEGDGGRNIVAPPIARLVLRVGSGRGEDGGNRQYDNGAQG